MRTCLLICLPCPSHHLSHNFLKLLSAQGCASRSALATAEAGPQATTLRVEGWDLRGVQNCGGRGRQQG